MGVSVFIGAVMFTHVDPKTQIKMSTKDKKIGDLWITLISRIEEEEKEWVNALKKAGVKAAHPDDGWIDRTKNIVRFVYPYFYTNLAPGDVIALGRPGRYRFVKAIERIKPSPIDLSQMITWKFK